MALNFHVLFDFVTTSNGCLSSDEFLSIDTSISLEGMVLSGTVDYKETTILLLLIITRFELTSSVSKY